MAPERSKKRSNRPRNNSAAVAYYQQNFAAAQQRRALKEERLERGAGVRGAHESFSDEKGVNAACAHARNVGRRQDATLRDDDAFRRNAREQRERCVEARLERTQVAVVDAEERRLQLQRALELLGVVHLNQHRHAQAMCERLELAELRIIEAGDDEKNAIGAKRACLVHLVGIDDEVFAQRW